MTTILFVIGGIYRNYFKWNYLRTKFFSEFVAAFLNSKSSFEQFEENDYL